MEKYCDDSRFKDLEKKIELLKNMRGAIIPCLQEAQSIFGYLSPEIVDLIASKLNVSSEKVYGVASFYSQFKLQKIGKHKVSVCMGTACYVKGAEDVLKAVKKVLNIEDGETTEDEFYSLDTVRCVGCCSLAPLMLIDDTLYPKVLPSQVESILSDFKQKNS